MSRKHSPNFTFRYVSSPNSKEKTYLRLSYLSVNNKAHEISTQILNTKSTSYVVTSVCANLGTKWVFEFISNMTSALSTLES